MICDTCEKYPCDMDGTKLWHRCFAYSPKPKPITNADRIRSMTDERLAVEMYAKGGCPHDCETPDDMDTDCVQCWLDWLREEASP